MELLNFLKERISEKATKKLVSNYVSFYPMLGAINKANRAATALKRAVTPRPTGGVAFTA